MNFYKFYIITLSFSFLVVFHTADANPNEQVTHGNKSQNIQGVKGNVNTNFYKAGDKVATVRINNKNINKKTVVTPIQTNININELKRLVIPKTPGFSEIFYNKQSNRYIIKNHKYRTTIRLNLSKVENNYIDNSIINKTQLTKNNINNGTLIKSAGTYTGIGFTETYQSDRGDNIKINTGDGNDIVIKGNISYTEIYDAGVTYAPFSHIGFGIFNNSKE